MRVTYCSENVEYHSWTAFNPHPRNMRRVYPRGAVEQMARSIRANYERGGPGIIQPLLGCRVNPSTSSGHRGKICIYAGHLRWRGAAYLGVEAPPVPVIIRSPNELDQMLDMAIENRVRFDPDPLSEALHYKALLDAGLSKNRVARELGVSLPTIVSRLQILDLPEQVQLLFAEDRLPRLAAEPLLELRDPELQVAAARFLAEQNASLAVVKETCRRIAGQVRRAKLELEPEPEPEKPAAKQDETRGGNVKWQALSDEPPAAPAPTLVAIPPIAPVPFDELELLIRATCAACELGRMIQEEILWEDMHRAARAACRACDVRGLRDTCGQCPLPDLLRKLRTVLEARHGRK